MIIELLAGAKLGTVGKATTAATPAFSVVLAQANGMINDGTGISLVFCAAVGGGCWYLSNRFTRIEDKLEEMQANLKKLPCTTTNEKCK